MSQTTFTSGRLAGLTLTKSDFVRALCTMGVTRIVMNPADFDDLLNEIEALGMTRPSRLYAMRRGRLFWQNSCRIEASNRHWWHALIWEM